MIALPLFRPCFSGGGYHPTAMGIITGIQTRLGSSISLTQKAAIDTFIKAEILAGRWGTVTKRFHVFGWANASANALDWVALGNGTFSGSVDQTNPGYIKGDGSTGYFDMGISASALGLTPTAGGLTALVKTPDTRTDFRCLIGASQGAGNQENYLAHDSSTAVRFSYNVFGGGAGSLLGTLARASQHGIISGGRVGTDMRMRRRNSAGVSSIGSQSNTNTGTVSTLNLNVARLNGSNAFYSNAEIGAACVDVGMSIAERDAFSADLKTLWETCFNLTLT